MSQNESFETVIAFHDPLTSEAGRTLALTKDRVRFQFANYILQRLDTHDSPPYIYEIWKDRSGGRRDYIKDPKMLAIFDVCPNIRHVPRPYPDKSLLVIDRDSDLIMLKMMV